VTLTPGQTFYEGPTDIHTLGRNASSSEAGAFRVFLKNKGAESWCRPSEQAGGCSHGSTDGCRSRNSGRQLNRLLHTRNLNNLATTSARSRCCCTSCRSWRASSCAMFY